jgi:hypothetical protein
MREILIARHQALSGERLTADDVSTSGQGQYLQTTSVLPVRKGRSNSDARHGAQDDWRSDLRGGRLLLCTPAIW